MYTLVGRHTINTNEWIDFIVEDYQKDLQFVEVHGGIRYGPCYPNAGVFHILDDSEDSDKGIPYSEVKKIKILTDEEFEEWMDGI